MFGFDVPEKLLRLVRRFARGDLLDKLTGLVLSPAYASNVARLETLIHLALAGEGGKKRATRNDLSDLLNGFERHDAFLSEDPAEDVFVAAVSTDAGNFRIFVGNHAGADYTLQRLLDAVFGETFARRDAIKRQCEALLRLSDLIAERCGFEPGVVEDSTPRRQNWPLGLPDLLSRGGASIFSEDELVAANIDTHDLEPFILPSVDGLLNATFNTTRLHRYPLIREGQALRLPNPSFVSLTLRLYLAQAINFGFIPQEATKRFHNEQYARWLFVDLPLRKAKSLDVASLGLPEPAIPDIGLSQAVIQFDEDKVLHFFVMECDWRDPPETDIYAGSAAKPKLQKALTDYLKAVHEVISKKLGISRGLTLVVGDSPGWAVVPHLPEKYSDTWFITGLPSRSLSILLDDPAFILIDLWKMLRDRDRLEAMGIEMTAWPEILNHWSIWQAFGSTFWPPGIDVRKFGRLHPDTSKIIEKLVSVRQSTNRHAAPLVDGQWLAVERWIEDLSPSQDYVKPIYLSPMAIVSGTLRAAIENGPATWWVATARPPFDPQDRQLMYLVWQAATEWLLRIGKTAAGRIPLTKSPLEIRILLTPESITDGPDAITFIRSEVYGCTTIVFPPSLPDQFMTVDNAGEAALVRALVDAICSLTNAGLSDVQKADWVSELTADPDLKLVHATPHGDHGFAADLVADKVAARFLQDADTEVARRFVRDELPDSSKGQVAPPVGPIAGKDDLSKILHAVVDLHWHRSQKVIKELDKKRALILVTRLIEALHRQRVSDERSGRARNSLYADSPEWELRAQANMAWRDQAFMTYRVVAEMLLCDAPVTGGRAPGLTDIDQIAAEVAELTQVAHNSDALHRNMIVPSAVFDDVGSLVMGEGGAATLIRDYQSANFAESLALDVDSYPGLYEPRTIADPDEILKPDDPFVVAFLAEFRIGLRQAFEILGALQDIAVERESDFVCLPLDEVRGLLRSSPGQFDNTTIDAFFNAFGLKARKAWDAPPPKPYTRLDVFPWIFERRLSLMLRPVLLFRDAKGASIAIFGIRQLEMGITYASHLLEKGDWPPDRLVSLEAKAWLEIEGNRRGLAFESEVKEIFEHAGWKADQGVPMTRFGAPVERGDLDVLAIAPDGKTWWVVECKWFGAARTPREIANWLQGFQGKADDKLDRHLKRYAWIRDNAAAVAGYYKIALPETIVPKIVTTRPVPIYILRDLPPGSEVVTRRELVVQLSVDAAG